MVNMRKMSGRVRSSVPRMSGGLGIFMVSLCNNEYSIIKHSQDATFHRLTSFPPRGKQSVLEQSV